MTSSRLSLNFTFFVAIYFIFISCLEDYGPEYEEYRHEVRHTVMKCSIRIQYTNTTFRIRRKIGRRSFGP